MSAEPSPPPTGRRPAGPATDPFAVRVSADARRAQALRLAGRTVAGGGRRLLSSSPVSFGEPVERPIEPIDLRTGPVPVVTPSPWDTPTVSGVRDLRPAMPPGRPAAELFDPSRSTPPQRPFEDATTELRRVGDGPVSRRARRLAETGAQPIVPDAAPPGDGPPTEQLPAVPPAKRTSRAGRNLPAAIGVGAVLGGLILASLLFRKEIFVGLVSGAIVIAVWELAGALAQRRVQVPVVPLVVGSLGMLVSAYVAREEGLLVAFALTAFGLMLWRIIDGVQDAARDVAAAVFTAAYVPFLAGFAIVMLAAPDGARRVLIFIAVTVASDIGGYAAGVLFGKHPMAPSVSPKKSWEGFGGSVLACVVVATVLVPVLLGGALWVGPLLGLATAVFATLGDLAESMIKRDLGIKDMGSFLPGHGGMMDRIDSLLVTAPVIFLMLSTLVPAA